MSNLKRSAIRLVTGVNGEEVDTKVYRTSPFIPTRVVYEALDLAEEVDENPENKKERDLLDSMAAFVAEKAYGNQFTTDELIDGLHAPEAIATLQEQLAFIANGKQSNEVKKLLEKSN